jgi:DNA-binding CsgD family transcriptional regulator
LLDAFLDAVRAGEGRALVLRGEAGVGKTALLEYLAARASGCRVLRVAGVQSEMELAFAGLHQLVLPVLDGLEPVPEPQRDALWTAFGIRTGPAPDRFLIALAVLSVLSDAAGAQPLLCLVDDEQWLDRTSVQALAFVARRLGADPVGLVFASRLPSAELAEVPALQIDGLGDADARVLLDAVLSAPVDPRVREQIVREAGGNPLALVELPRSVTPAELAGGFVVPGAMSMAGGLEERFARRVRSLPASTRRLLLVAAADPIGEPSLVWAAAGRLGIGAEVLAPAVEAGVVEFGARVRFRHPLVRSAVYWAASVRERQDVHRVLAEVTDPETDPDRRAWHRAQAAAGPDEAVAAELERSADRARARGGIAAAAAFREKAAMVTPAPERRARRLLAAARAKRDAGALEGALGLLDAAEAGPPDARRSAEVRCQRGQIALEQHRGGEAARLLLGAARQLAPFDPGLARETYLDALVAALWAGDPARVLAAAGAMSSAPAAPRPEQFADVLLDGLARRVTEGYSSAAAVLGRALAMALDEGVETGAPVQFTDIRPVAMAALELWDADAWFRVVSRRVQAARKAGALVQLRLALNHYAGTRILVGEFGAAELAIEQQRLIAEGSGNTPTGHHRLLLAAWRGQQSVACEQLPDQTRRAGTLGVGRLAALVAVADAVRANALGHHRAACEAVWPAFQRDDVGYGPLIVPELAEAASRVGDHARVEAVLAWLAERTRVTPTAWVLGVEARVRALAGAGDDTEDRYRESIAHLGHTPARVELARSHLLYGEWLRRANRRVDARGQLRTAHEMFASMGAEAFAERTRRELLATGATARRRTVPTSDRLTAQEQQIASLARDGLSNPEIAARLFISPRTVQYHLGKVFAKLGIRSRAQLHRVLSSGTEPAGPDRSVSR